MGHAFLADERREIAADEHAAACAPGRRRCPSRIGVEERRRAEQPARDAEGEARGVALHRADVAGRNIVERDRVDQHEPRDALGPERGEAQRDGGADVDADDGGARDAQRGERALEIVGLGGDPEVRVERAVRLAVAEEVDGERGVLA